MNAINPGRQPEWRTSGEFRWKLSIDKIEDVLLYISQNPTAKDALIKSQTIFRILQANIDRLVGTVWIGGQSVPHKYDEPAEIIHILNGESANYKLFGWNGRWVYTESNQLVSHREISKHDLNKSLYRYACQLCHKPFANVEMCQLERKPDVELDPLNLCLCPSCAQRFIADDKLRPCHEIGHFLRGCFHLSVSLSV